MPQSVWKFSNLGEHGESIRAQGSRTTLGGDKYRRENWLVGEGEAGGIGLAIPGPTR